jgi:hypothetical protein
LPKFKGKYIGKSLYLYIEKLLLHKGVKRVIAYSTITAKPMDWLASAYNQCG